MKIKTLIDILVLDKNAPIDCMKTLMTQTVFLQRSMKLSNKCHLQQSLMTSSREFSAAMEVLVLPFKILRASNRFQDHWKLKWVQTIQRITKRYLILSGVTLMKQKKKVVSNITMSETLKSRTISSTLDLTT